MGIEPVVVNFTQTPDLEIQFQRVVAADVQAVYVPVATYLNANQVLCDLLVRNNLASISASSAPPVCTLVAYAGNSQSQYHKLASYIDAILKGANPEDLPVQEPTVFDFVVNLTTAKALGLTIPQSLLLQATEVIQ